MNKKSTYKEIYEEIKKHKNIILVSHKSPDGDAIGSTLGFCIALQGVIPDANFRVVLQDTPPDSVAGISSIVPIEQYDASQNYERDLVIFLDTSTLERSGVCEALTQDTMTICIDHHVSNEGFCDMNYIREVSSTSEVVYDFVKEMNIPLTKDAAKCLYTGLIGDTGNFEHDNVTPHTFQMAADLISYGINNADIVRAYYKDKSLAAMHLIGEALTHMQYDEKNKLVYYYLSQETAKRYNARTEDSDQIVDKILEYKNCNVALFLREAKDNTTKGSLRSKHGVNVSEIAKVFGGGGHVKAAGFVTTEDIDVVVARVKDLLNHI